MSALDDNDDGEDTFLVVAAARSRLIEPSDEVRLRQAELKQTHTNTKVPLKRREPQEEKSLWLYVRTFTIQLQSRTTNAINVRRSY